ncbi:MAG: hypothetical protein IKT43_00460 [Clostridia bacterium]|nr:hypothetical protein [Clostridia bacterium]
MKCPRCKTVPEDENALYCLVCGKQLRRDDAFDGEFEEEFRYDEEIEAEKQQKELQEKLIAVEKRALLLRCAAATLGIFLLIGLTLFLLLPRENTDDTPSSFEAQGNPEETKPDKTKETIASLAENLLTAMGETYDLDVILNTTMPTERSAVLAELCATYHAKDEAELRATFLRLKEELQTKLSDFSTSVSDALTREELEALELSIPAHATEVRRVTVLCLVTANAQSHAVNAQFYFVKSGDSYYSLNLQ